ncbi:uncharacterized protein LOC110832713 isoform X2 [Zootermopsis nevadensis]|uniref:uncharacterized protein LOC110832713 isoform X2 n=1 Tax=Zootermopsis nevadensis TaxID=136037 RepID=UPI000B8E3B3F|nr:uncharacterized protein LOC110832713 isoform X2 [Zootermopsis nevadensis]
MVVSDASIHNIMGGMESTAGVRLHNHRRKLKQRFDIIKKLGQGTYGKVQLGINKETGQEVAIKTIKKAKIETEADLVRIRREIQIMSSVQHPNIIHIYEVFENREKMVLVMEYAAGGELYDFLSERKVLAEEEARRIFRQIATAVYYCHKHKICHRDLKLENILLDEYGSAKIADFGLSNVFDEQRLLNTFCGSPLYASPEIVKGTPYHGPEVDCWSLGVLLYTLVYGAMPFDGSNFKRLVKQISQGDYFEPKKPSPASPLIREMLTVTPARRADIEKICSHWWVNEGHAESCLDIAEELANQTPVRLDLLLSLAPPPPAVGSDKMLLTDEQGDGNSGAVATDQIGPPRCHSVGSLTELDVPSAERRIREFQMENRRGSGGDAKDTPKRKLEEGTSTEDAARGGAKRKERVGRREHCVEQKESAVRSSSWSRRGSDTEENRQSMSVPEEKMDVDVNTGLHEPISSNVTKEPNDPLAGNGEILKDKTHVAMDSAESCKADTVTQTTLEKDPTKTTTTRDRTTRKSVKGSTKKSKPPSVDGVPSNTETLLTKDMEPEEKAAQNKEQGTGVEKNAEQMLTTAQVPSGESEIKEGTDKPPVEAIKPKVKKKKKVLNNSISDTSVENKQNSTEVGLIESSQQPTDAKSNLNDSSSQKVKEVVVKTEADESKTNRNSDVSDKILKNCVSSSKDSSENRTVDVPKTAGVKTKKSRGDLSLGKLSSSNDKSSGAEELATPTKPVERRRSKIFENADKFNIFLGGSDPKSPTTEKPKKVFIPGVKVSDYKQAFERRSSLSSTSLPTPVKNSTSKKAVEQNSKIIPTKSLSCDNGNVDASRAVKDVERNSNNTDLTTTSGFSSSKESENSQHLKQEEASPESVEDNQSSMESCAVQTDEINSVRPNTKVKKDGADGGENISAEESLTAGTLKCEEADLKLVPALQMTDKVSQQEKARIKKLKDAVEIISNAIAEESKRETDPSAVKKITSTKPPVPSSPDKPKTKSAGSCNSSSPKSPPISPTDTSSGKRTIYVQVAPNDVRIATVQVSTPQSTNFPFDDKSIAKQLADKGSETLPEKQSANEANKNEDSDNIHKQGDTSASKTVKTNLDPSVPAKKKSAKVEITLKSATLPRRRTSKTEIQLGFASSQPTSRPESGAPGEYRTEVEHMVGSPSSRLLTQRSEVAFPVAAAADVKPLSYRSSSLEPEGTPSSKSKPREHIIPIRVEKDMGRNTVCSPPPAKPPVPSLQQQRSLSQRSSSLSRQSTQDSDTDSTISATGPEPIRKSPREYIIPIAVEGGGYVTPRAGSLEPSVSEASTEASRQHHRSSGRFSKPRRMSLLSDSGASEDEGFNNLNSPFVSLQRHSSLGNDDLDDERPFHHMHRLRSSRPSRRPPLEHNDSLSSAEEDDDDDGFEILTAESLFSTLLSRVRSLTQRLNVEDGGRPGFPSTRLLSHLATSPTSGFWSNMYGRPGEPLSRRISESQFSRSFGHDGDGPTPWRRSVSRDISDSDSVYSDTANAMTRGGTLPRGPSRFDRGGISDDAGSDLSSSYYYAPSLARQMPSYRDSSSQDIGSQSNRNQQTTPSDYLAPVRKSSLGSLASQGSNIPQHTSRRLSRTLSLRSTADEMYNSRTPRNVDLSSRNSYCSDFGGQEGKSIHKNSSVSLCRQDCMPITEESTRYTRKDHLPPTRRSLSLLDSKDRNFISMSTHRGGSSSDCGDYGRYNKPLDMDRVLPPLPYNTVSQGRKREASQSSSSARQRSYGYHSNGSSHHLRHSSIEEEFLQDRPHHSSSLPSIARSEEKKSIFSYAGKPTDKVNAELEASFNYEVDKSSSSSVNSKSTSNNSSMPSQLNNSEFQNMGNSSLVHGSMSGIRNKLQNNSLSKNSINASSSSESKGRSQIPSLLRFRSSTVNCDVEKQKKRDRPNNDKEGTDSVRKLRTSNSPRSTPDRSILSRFLRQSSEGKVATREADSASDDKDTSKKKRRISRFLRPDFFDTPREESVYAKEKDAKKAAEMENKLKLRKNLKKVVAEDKESPSEVQDSTEIGSSSILSEDRLKTKSISVSSGNINTENNNINSKNRIKSELEQTGEGNGTGNEMREKLNDMNDTKKVEKCSTAFEKQSSNSNNKSRFLHSLEKKLEKFRSSGDCIPSISNSGKSRVDKAIHSLREHSLTPRGGDIITSESHLLKRAVSVSECCTVESSSKNHKPFVKENAASKLGSKVTSVLGLFRKLEDTPGKTGKLSPPRPSVLSRLRRTQSVYGGSRSDSVLLDHGADIGGSSEFKPVRPLRLKKANSNSSVVKKNPVESHATIHKKDLETGKKTETQSQNPGLNMLENKKAAELTVENVLGNEAAVHNSSNVQEISISERGIAVKQQGSGVPKLIKRGSIKSKTKNIIETSIKAQPRSDPRSDSDAKSAHKLELDKCSKDLFNMRPLTESNTKLVQPDTLTGLKGLVAVAPESTDTLIVKKLETSVDTNEGLSLVMQEVTSAAKAMCIPHDCGNKNDFVRRENDAQVSSKSCVDAGKAEELKPCTNSGISPTTDNAFDNSPVDDYSLNDDEVKFADVKCLDSHSYPADDSSVLSPADESESFDSWSVCSDAENREFPPSPVPLPGNDVEESVGDRIRRKSFYSRFNDVKKRHRKSSLSPVACLSSSYRDTDSLSYQHHPRNFSRKMDHPADYASMYHLRKPYRSQSVLAENDYDDGLATYSRRSSVSPRSHPSSYTDYDFKPLITENVTKDMNGFVDDFSLTDQNYLPKHNQGTSVSSGEGMQTRSTAGENVSFLGGSVEKLRMPRHFNHNVNFNTSQYQPLYSDTIRRGSDSRLSRSTESDIGTAIVKSRLPTIWNQHLSVAPGYASSSSSVAGASYPDDAMRLGLVAGETSPLHGKYNRYNSNSPLDVPSSVFNGSPTTTGENLWMESEWPVAPR